MSQSFAQFAASKQPKLTLPPAINANSFHAETTSKSNNNNNNNNTLNRSNSTVTATTTTTTTTFSALSKLPSSNKLDIGLQLIPGTSINFDALQKVENKSTKELLSPHYPNNCIEMIDSERWIKKYGLKANKLTYEHILNLIGFKQPQGFFFFSLLIIYIYNYIFSIYNFFLFYNFLLMK